MNIDTIDKRKNIINDLWTWYPCGVACGAGEMIEETSDLTGSSWSTSGQYLRAGGGCSSLLIRRKSTTDDEYHHVDIIGAYGVITNGTVNIISSCIYDKFKVPLYSQGNIMSDQISTNYVLTNDDLVSIQNNNNFILPTRSLVINPIGSIKLLSSASNFCFFICHRFFSASICNQLCGIKPPKPCGGCPTGQQCVHIHCKNATIDRCVDPTDSTCCTSNGDPYAGPSPLPCMPTKQIVKSHIL